MIEVKFGVQIGLFPFGVPPAGDLYHFAEVAEEAGFDGLWLGDHIMMHQPILESLTLLSAFAGRTSRINLGIGVLLLALRHPTVIAKMVSTLDYLTKGRVILGVGVGGENPVEWQACGVPVKERGARTNEGIEIMRKLWTQDNVTYRGRFYSFEGVTLEPKPAQAKGPRLIIGGRSDAALRRAAKYGDGWMSYLFTSERYKDSLAKITTYAQELSRELQPSFLPAHLQFIYASSDRGNARKTAAEYISRNYNQPFDELVDRYCIYGTPAECVEKLGRFVEAGVRYFVFRSTCPPSELIDQTETLARDVVSQFR